MPVLMLNEDEVRGLLTMELAIEAVELALRKMALEEAHNVPRSRVQTDHVMLHVMSSAAKTLGYAGYKAYSTTRKGASFHVGLYDSKTGELVSLMKVDYLGQVRTGAASGVATKFLARPDCAEVGIYGSGKQAKTQLSAVCLVRKISRVQVYSPNESRRLQFAQEMSEQCGVTVEPVDRPELAARDKDIIITATTSREPVLNGSWVADGCHINAIGSNFMSKAEVDVATLKRCKTIVVDSKEQARLEAGDFTQALEEGAIHWSDIRELGQVLVGRYPGRTKDYDITLFKSLGIALEDIAVAARVYALAKQQGVGKEVDW
jgi:alanine dehydrogenase